MRREMENRKLLYRAIRGFVALLFHVFFRIEFEEQKYIPTQGPIVIASNHLHNLDPMLLGVMIHRYVRFMAKEELFRPVWFAHLLRYLGAFPVKRGLNDKAAIRQAIQVTADGGCLLIFPEGHRSKDGRLGKGMPGVAFIARKANCAIVPVAITGKYKFRDRVTVRFGEPIIPSPDDTNETVLDTLMVRIQSLIDEGTSCKLR